MDRSQETGLCLAGQRGALAGGEKQSTTCMADCADSSSQDLHRFASPMLKVEFEGPDVREEEIYKIFRVGDVAVSGKWL